MKLRAYLGELVAHDGVLLREVHDAEGELESRVGLSDASDVQHDLQPMIDQQRYLCDDGEEEEVFRVGEHSAVAQAAQEGGVGLGAVPVGVVADLGGAVQHAANIAWIHNLEHAHAVSACTIRVELKKGSLLPYLMQQRQMGKLTLALILGLGLSWMRESRKSPGVMSGSPVSEYSRLANARNRISEGLSTTDSVLVRLMKSGCSSSLKGP